MIYACGRGETHHLLNALYMQISSDQVLQVPMN